MEVEELSIDGKFSDLKLITPSVFNDNRGWFKEVYNKEVYKQIGVGDNFVQDNISRSIKKNVIRGLHYQAPPFAQAKLVEVISGKVIDIAVDLRKDSPTFKQWLAVELSDENHYQFYIPEGFAHGFITLTDNVIFHYKCSNYYSKEHERGILFSDPELGLTKKVFGYDISEDMDRFCISDKDKALPLMSDIKSFEE